MSLSIPTGRRVRPLFAALATALLATLAACGGGTSQEDPFKPTRLIVFGDETSTITAEGRKYSVNGLNTAGTIDCTVQPIWVQSVATVYSFVFPQCNPTNVVGPQAKMLAAPGAKVAQVAAQIDAQVAAGGFTQTDLTTVMAGANDVIELYQQFPTRNEADLVAEARRRGEQLALQVNRIVNLGGKVILANMLDMGLTPYALKQNTAFPGTDRIGLLTRLSAGFNEQLGVKIILDGRYIGLVQTDLRVQTMSRVPAAFGLTNVSDGVCTTPLPDCTTTTVATGNDASLFLWADDLRLAYFAQNQIGQLAADRAQRNPF